MMMMSYLGVIVQSLPSPSSKVIIAFAETEPKLTITIIMMIIHFCDDNDDEHNDDDDDDDNLPLYFQERPSLCSPPRRRSF